MKHILSSFALSIAVAVALPAAAQATDPAATKAIKPAVKPLTPVQQSQATRTPGELRPEQPVTPQITAPIGRVPPPLTAEPAPTPPETLNQRLARCQAELGEQARAECRQRAELARPPAR